MYVYLNCKIAVHSVSCRNPNYNNPNIEVVGLRYPIIEGSSITFRCPPGLMLSGYNTSTCMRNREWKPDPENIDCKG